jgi:hypothetical protein
VLTGVVHRLARPGRAQHLERLVEHARPHPVVGLLPGGGQLAAAVTAQADAQDEPPPLSRSSVAISRASFTGRRRASGVTIGPSRTRSVVIAMAASTTHGSATACTGAR